MNIMEMATTIRETYKKGMEWNGLNKISLAELMKYIADNFEAEEIVRHLKSKDVINAYSIDDIVDQHYEGDQVVFTDFVDKYKSNQEIYG